MARILVADFLVRLRLVPRMLVQRHWTHELERTNAHAAMNRAPEW